MEIERDDWFQEGEWKPVVKGTTAEGFHSRWAGVPMNGGPWQGGDLRSLAREFEERADDLREKNQHKYAMDSDWQPAGATDYDANVSPARQDVPSEAGTEDLFDWDNPPSDSVVWSEKTARKFAQRIRDLAGPDGPEDLPADVVVG